MKMARISFIVSWPMRTHEMLKDRWQEWHIMTESAVLVCFELLETAETMSGSVSQLTATRAQFHISAGEKAFLCLLCWEGGCFQYSARLNLTFTDLITTYMSHMPLKPEQTWP